MYFQLHTKATVVMKVVLHVCTILRSLVFVVTPNEALPHIGRQPWRNANDDRCNLPALL